MHNNLKEITKVATSKDNVGLQFIDGIPSITLPQGFDNQTNEEQLKKDIHNVFLMLEKYKKKSIKNINSNKDIINDDKGEAFPFGSYLYLTKYFIINGNYKEAEKIYKKEKQVRNTSWARTIKQTNPIYSNNNPIYTEFINKKNINLNTNNFIEVYKYAINQSYEIIGKLFYKNIKMPNYRTLDTKYCIRTLKQELRNTNIDKKKTLIKHMLNIFNGNDNGINKENSFTVKRFEYVWEQMIDSVYGNHNIEDNTELKATYVLNTNETFNSSATRPDTIHLDNLNNKLYIIDAKYYQYGFIKDNENFDVTKNKSSLPATSDIRKQIAYSKSFKDMYKDKYIKNLNIFNIFMLPSKNMKDVPIGKAYFNKGKSNKTEDPNENEVEIHLISIKNLIQDYIKTKTRTLNEIKKEV